MIRRKMEGVVKKLIDVSTVVVEVERKYKHKKYGKIIKSHKKYLVDKSEVEVEVDTMVLIEETRPISKKKHFKILEIIK